MLLSTHSLPASWGEKSDCCCRPRPGLDLTRQSPRLLGTSIKMESVPYLWGQRIIETMCAIHCNRPTSRMLYLLDLEPGNNHKYTDGVIKYLHVTYFRNSWGLQWQVVLFQCAVFQLYHISLHRILATQQYMLWLQPCCLPTSTVLYLYFSHKLWKTTFNRFNSLLVYKSAFINLFDHAVQIN